MTTTNNPLDLALGFLRSIGAAPPPVPRDPAAEELAARVVAAAQTPPPGGTPAPLGPHDPAVLLDVARSMLRDAGVPLPPTAPPAKPDATSESETTTTTKSEADERAEAKAREERDRVVLTQGMRALRREFDAALARNEKRRNETKGKKKKGKKNR